MCFCVQCLCGPCFYGPVPCRARPAHMYRYSHRQEAGQRTSSVKGSSGGKRRLGRTARSWAGHESLGNMFCLFFSILFPFLISKPKFKFNLVLNSTFKFICTIIINSSMQMHGIVLFIFVLSIYLYYTLRVQRGCPPSITVPPPWRPRPPHACPRPCLPSPRVRIRRFRCLLLLLPPMSEISHSLHLWKATTRRAQPSSDSATPSSDSRRRPPRVPPPDDPVPRGFSAATAAPSPPSTHPQPHSHDCPRLKTPFPTTSVSRPSRHPHPSATPLPRRAIPTHPQPHPLPPLT
jgi:hypothetical protein